MVRISHEIKTLETIPSPTIACNEELGVYTRAFA